MSSVIVRALSSGSLLTAWLAAQAVLAADMTVVEFRDHEPDTPDYVSRYVLQDDRLRLDYGRDDDDFVLYDRALKQIWMVSHSLRQVTELAVEVAQETVPVDWQVSQELLPVKAGLELQVKLKSQDCLVAQSGSPPDRASGLMGDFKRALSGNQRDAWQATPVDLQESCQWLLEVVEAGIEYRHGLPAQLGYWDGRSRRLLNRRAVPARSELFVVPQEYALFRVGQSSQSSRQPSPSQPK